MLPRRSPRQMPQSVPEGAHLLRQGGNSRCESLQEGHGRLKEQALTEAFPLREADSMQGANIQGFVAE